MTSSPP